MSNNNAAAINDTFLNTELADIDQIEYDTAMSKFSRSYVKLSKAQRKLMKYVLENYESGNIETKQKLAENAGVDYKTLAHAFVNDDFLTCLGEILPKYMKANTPFMYGKLLKHADKSYKAIELWARITGEYIPQSRQQNVNININEFSDDQAGKLDGILMKLLELGHSPEDIYMRMSELTGKVLDMPAEPEKAKE